MTYDPENVVVNSYRGGIYQQALSHLAYIDDDGFVDGGGDFAVYGTFLYSDFLFNVHGSEADMVQDSNSLPTPIIEMKATSLG